MYIQLLFCSCASFQLVSGCELLSAVATVHNTWDHVLAILRQFPLGCLVVYYLCLPRIDHFLAMGWVENWMAGVPLPNPDPGVFDIDCPQLVLKVGDVACVRMVNATTFGIHRDRLEDFVKGEEERGCCTLLTNHVYHDKYKPGNVVGANMLCSRGKERKESHQKKAASAPVLQQSEGTRRSKINLGESSKLGCTYSLSWHEYLRQDGHSAVAVFVKNNGLHVKEGETTPVHGLGSDAADHLRLPLTDECKRFVWGELVQRSTQQQIIQRAYTTPSIFE